MEREAKTKQNKSGNKCNNNSQNDGCHLFLRATGKISVCESVFICVQAEFHFKHFTFNQQTMVNNNNKMKREKKNQQQTTLVQMSAYLDLIAFCWCWQNGCATDSMNSLHTYTTIRRLCSHDTKSYKMYFCYCNRLWHLTLSLHLF